VTRVTSSNENGSDLRSLSAIIDRAMDEARRDQVAVGDIVEAFGSASFVPLLLVPAVAVVTPLSGIPAFSSLCGIAIFLISVQWLIGRECVWLPQWIMRRDLSGDRVGKALTNIRPWAARLDRHTRKRLSFLFRRPFRVLPQLSCTLFGAMMPFLELVPFSSSLLGAAVTLLALSMLTRDGLYALIALLPVAAVTWAIVRLFV